MLRTLYRKLPLAFRLDLRRMFGNAAKFAVSDIRGLGKVHGAGKLEYYYDYYPRYLPKKIDLLLEIGIGGYDDPIAGGNSLRMWRDFYPDAQIWGIDIQDKSHHDEKRIQTFKGSQVDEEFLESVVTKSPDIIIDDGSHIPEHVIKTFEILFPKLKAGGLYIVEDTETSYWETETIMPFFKELTDCPNNQFRKEYTLTYYDQNVKSIHFHKNMIFIEKA